VPSSSDSDVGYRLRLLCQPTTTRSRTTQAQLADATGMSIRWVRDLLAGRVDPTTTQLRKLADAFNVSIFELLEGPSVTAPAWVRPEASPLVSELAEQEKNPMDRRQFFKTGALTAAGLAGGTVAGSNPESWQRLANVLEGRARVDETLIEHLGDVTSTFERLAPQLGHRALLASLLGHLEAIGRLLDGGMSNALRSRLTSVAAETTVVSATLLWYRGDQHESGRFFHQALQMASDAGDKRLGAYILGRIGLHGFQPKDRIQLLQGGGYGFHPRDASPNIQAWLIWVQADAASDIGEEVLCLRLYDQVRQIRSSGAQENGGDARPFVPVDDAGDLGGSLVRLGRYEQARAELDTGIGAARGKDYKVQQGWLLAAKAQTYIRNDDPEPDEAARVAGLALDLGQQLQAHPITKAVRDIANALQPWEGRVAVTELRERLSTS
jgi:transcriptional regulator with XRE-family HTH domain